LLVDSRVPENCGGNYTTHSKQKFLVTLKKWRHLVLIKFKIQNNKKDLSFSLIFRIKFSTHSQDFEANFSRVSLSHFIKKEILKKILFSVGWNFKNLLTFLELCDVVFLCHSLFHLLRISAADWNWGSFCLIY
jgi:hypothetical protein